MGFEAMLTCITGCVSLIDLERFAVVDEVFGNMLLSVVPTLVARTEHVRSSIALELASCSSDSTFA